MNSPRETSRKIQAAKHELKLKNSFFFFDMKIQTAYNVLISVNDMGKPKIVLLAFFDGQEAVSHTNLTQAYVMHFGLFIFRPHILQMGEENHDLLLSDPTFYKWGRKIMICDALFFQILPNLHNLHLLITYLTIT